MTRQHMPYRSHEEIRYAILGAIKEYESKGGILRTRLMMTANITNVQLHSYLQEFLANELITCDSSKVRHVAASARRGVTKIGDRFHITEKGEKYLSMLAEMRHMGIGVLDTT